MMTDDSTASGLVVSQTPASGAKVKKGGACTLKINWFKLEKHPYAAYEKIEYQIPSDEKAGLYEAYVSDSHSKRIRFSKNAAPGQKIVFIFRREGNATITFRCNKKRISDTDIDVD